MRSITIAFIFWLISLNVLAAEAGIALQFDDDFLTQWCGQRTFFKDNQMKLTFFITRPNRFNKEKLDCIKALIADGHEIGAHGYEHQNPKEYIAQHGLQAFLTDEIDRPQALLEDLGIFPLSYAYPWGGDTPELPKILEKYFMIQRSTGSAKSNKNLYAWNQERFVRGAAIDIGKTTDEEIARGMQTAKTQNKVVLFYAHRILEDSPQSHINLERLNLIARLAHEQKLPFYPISELWFRDRFAVPQDGMEQLYSLYTTGSVPIATEMVNNRWTIASRFPAVDLPEPAQMTWRENPLNENYWRFVFYSLRPLKDLLFAYRKTKDEKYIKKMVDVLSSFMDKGVTSPLWREPHTAAYLGMSLVYYYKSLDTLGFLSSNLRAQIPAFLEVVSAHLREEKMFEWNNHGVTESLALLMIGLNFPNAPEAFTNFNLGRTRFLHLLDMIVDKSGVEIEQSPFYHFYTLKEYWEAYTYSQKFPVIFQGSHWQERIAKMVDFASYIVQPNGDVPLISSSIYLNVYKPQDKTLKAIGDVFPAMKYVLTQGTAGLAPKPASKLFAEGGFAILASDPEWVESFDDRTHIVFDVGPFRTNHSQHDALSVNIFGAGSTHFTDSGLYSYEPSAKKDYYFSSAAHNLVTVGTASQAKGNAVAQTFWQNNIAAYQSGYHDLYKNFRTKRGVLLLKDHTVVVLDEAKPTSPQGDKPFNLYWHLNPKTELRALDAQKLHYSIIRNGLAVGTLRLCYATTGQAAMHRGETNPIQGWYSAFYEKEEPNSVLAFKHQGQDFHMVTVIQFGNSGEGPTCQSTWDADAIRVQVAGQTGVNYDVRVDRFASKDESISVSSP